MSKQQLSNRTIANNFNKNVAFDGDLTRVENRKIQNDSVNFFRIVVGSLLFILSSFLFLLLNIWYVTKVRHAEVDESKEQMYCAGL